MLPYNVSQGWWHSSLATEGQGTSHTCFPGLTFWNSSSTIQVLWCYLILGWPSHFTINFWLSQSLVEPIWLLNTSSMGWEFFEICGRCGANDWNELLIQLTGTITCSNILHVEDGTNAQIWCGIDTKKGRTASYADKLCYIRRIYEGVLESLD